MTRPTHAHIHRELANFQAHLAKFCLDFPEGHPTVPAANALAKNFIKVSRLQLHDKTISEQLVDMTLNQCDVSQNQTIAVRLMYCSSDLLDVAEDLFGTFQTLNTMKKSCFITTRPSDSTDRQIAAG